MSTLQGIGNGVGSAAVHAPARERQARGQADASQAPTQQASYTAVSRPAQFLSQLQDVAKSDPAQARQMLTELAARLRSPESSTPARSALADRVQQAADTGDLSLVLPKTQATGGGSAALKAYGAVATTRSSW